MEEAQVRTTVIAEFWPYNKPKPAPKPKKPKPKTKRRISGEQVDANFEQWRRRAETQDLVAALSRK